MRRAWPVAAAIALVASTPLPEPPAQSPRTASYTMRARLDEAAHDIHGWLRLSWRNDTGTPQSRFPLHLYANALRTTRATYARGAGRRVPRLGGEQAFGWIDLHLVRRVREDGPAEDLLPTLRWLRPDDANPDDRTLAEVTTAAPIPPGEHLLLEIEWTTRLPWGDVTRSGWVPGFVFAAQWFPKIAAHAHGRWNLHQFHARGEFFADYGVYDVTLDVPDGDVVGATGVLVERRRDAGRQTLRFRAEDVHDFAWTASSRFVERGVRVAEPGLSPVDVRLLVQPEHVKFADRYLAAARLALREMTRWSAPYPHPQLTIVDPAWSSGAAGMEYPMLVTGGVALFAPPGLHAPEVVTIHEVGHQFWQGLVGTNESEEAWLDEGVTRWLDRRIALEGYGAKRWARRYFGVPGADNGIPVIAPGVRVLPLMDSLASLRAHGGKDPLMRAGFEYLDARAYGVNTYTKPALALMTLEGLLGEEVMARVMQTWSRRYRYAHPTTADFVAVVSEVAGEDWQWFFDETFSRPGACDYAVSAVVRREPALRGRVDAAQGPVLVEDAGPAGWQSEVVVRRLGPVRLPVEVVVSFSDGRQLVERWDGRDTWARWHYVSDARVVQALVDPGRRIALDEDRSNNAWVAAPGHAVRASTKWTARFLLWLQDLLERHALVA